MAISITKTARYMRQVGTAAILAGLPILAPSTALADSYSDGVFNTAHKNSGDLTKDVSAGSMQSKVRSIAGWALGIAVSIFVLKVVLTAVDRILFDRESLETSTVGNTHYFSESFLVGLPIIGAYPSPEHQDGGETGYTWKRIWLNFMLQIAIAAGAWVIVSLLVGLVFEVSSRI